MAVRDVQSEIIAALQVLLADVGQVEEGDVRTIFDADDASYPDEFIVLQPGGTEEVLGTHPRMPNSVPERAVFNIVLVSKKREYAAGLRAMRLAVKVATAGHLCGLVGVAGITAAGFQPETPTTPGEGRRWAAHVMPLQISYLQPLK
ncbi:MAG: hypothetical protein KKG42_02275 [Gammaproteobacteria bacterium]|uniref:Tail terminator n=1 Tax=viral metagenome TaxID=1070528 RepID=A0A6M3M6H3_9ZZZZ|nr:hypothetical protein [Gammaproteobacteria bacterium]